MKLANQVLLLLTVLLTVPHSGTFAQEYVLPKNEIDSVLINQVILPQPHRGHFLSEEQLEKLSPAARAEVDQLLNDKQAISDLADRLTLAQQKLNVALQPLEEPVKKYRYMIGVVVVPGKNVDADATDADSKKGGVQIGRVTEDSPALKSGLKDGDSILKVGETEVSDIESLMDAIDASEGQEISLTIRRTDEDETVEVVQVTPVERPEQLQSVHATSSQEQQKLETWIDSLASSHHGVAGYHAIHPNLQLLSCQKCHTGVSNIQTIHPGVILDRRVSPLPDNLSITITRQGKQPAKIKVQREEHTWELTETDLEKLPADVRSHVEQMLMGPKLGLFRTTHPAVYPNHTSFLRLFTPQAQKVEPIPSKKEDEQINQQLKQVQQQLEELQKTVEKLQTEN